MSLPKGLGVLTLLGESADWLKDAQDVSVREHRLALQEAFRAAWNQPENEALHEAFRMAAAPLFEALRHNELCPKESLLSAVGKGAATYLADPKNARGDFDNLSGAMAVNKFGVAEIQLLYLVYLLCRSLHLEKTPYDPVLEKLAADIIFLRTPAFRADNVGAFSAELKARLHAVRILRCMKSIGLFDDNPVNTITPEDQIETRQVIADELRAAAAEYIQQRHHLPFVVLDTASTLEACGRARAAGVAPVDERDPEGLFARLRRHTRRLRRHEEIGPERAQRLFNLATAAIVRSTANVDEELGLKMYTFLRSTRDKPRIRHKRMFALLPNAVERLKFLNFLYTHGKRNPMYYVDRFQEFFADQKLQFVSKADGFKLQGDKPEG